MSKHDQGIWANRTLVLCCDNMGHVLSAGFMRHQVHLLMLVYQES